MSSASISTIFGCFMANARLKRSEARRTAAWDIANNSLREKS
jgi:hypothetical protein